MEGYNGTKNKQEDVYELIGSLRDRYEVSRTEILNIGDELAEITDNEFTYSELEAAIQEYRKESVETRSAAFKGMIRGGNVGEDDILEPEDTISAREIRKGLNRSINSINIGSTVGID